MACVNCVTTAVHGAENLTLKAGERHPSVSIRRRLSASS